MTVCPFHRWSDALVCCPNSSSHTDLTITRWGRGRGCWWLRRHRMGFIMLHTTSRMIRSVRLWVCIMSWGDVSQCVCILWHAIIIIGANLSKPHTDEFIGRCVCIYILYARHTVMTTVPLKRKLTRVSVFSYCCQRQWRRSIPITWADWFALACTTQRRL